MTYDAREASVHQGEPFELYLFAIQGQAWRLTSGQAARTYLGELYEPVALQRTETSQGQELRSGSIRVTLPREHPVAQQFASYLPASPMTLLIFRGHEGESEVVIHFTGSVAAAQFADACILTVAPEQDVLRRRIPAPEYQRRCNHILYDANCQVDPQAFKTVATVTFAVGVTVRADEFTALGTGWLDSGYLEKGLERRMILRHVGDTIELITSMPGLAVGDSVNVFAGCVRTAAICDSKFSNLVRFLGFEHIPRKNPFRGLE